MVRIIGWMLVAAMWLAAGCSHAKVSEGLQRELADYLKDKDATIGVAVIIDGRDTVSNNGGRDFPMLSVYKFPIAFALGEHLRTSAQLAPDSLTIQVSNLKPDTYSPMREKYAGIDYFKLSLHDLLAYALQQSDNNASDLMLDIIGGARRASHYLQQCRIDNINIISTEAEMHENPSLCYRNSATPIAMARLIDKFDTGIDDNYNHEVKQLMETCLTGRDRLAKPLTARGFIFGHKTGTGFTLPDGRLMALNDAGYVHLPDGRRYSIAVFVENSGYDLPQTEAIIARISEIVFNKIAEMDRK